MGSAYRRRSLIVLPCNGPRNHRHTEYIKKRMNGTHALCRSDGQTFAILALARSHRYSDALHWICGS